MLRQLRPVLAVAFAMLLLVAGSGDAFGAVAFRPDARIRDPFNAMSPTVGNNIYNATARHQRVKATGFPAGAPESFWLVLSIQNDGTTTDRFKVHASGALVTNGWKIQYFAENVGKAECGACRRTNVTRKVRNGTYVTPTVGHGNSLWMRVRFTSPTGEGAVPGRKITVHSMARPALVDAVGFSYSIVGCPC